MKGLWAESEVIRHFHRFPLLKQGMRTPFAQVDLILQKAPGLLLVLEVKTLSNFDFLPHRISQRQKERLFRACEYLRGHFRQSVELSWAFVTENGEILVIEDVVG